MATTSADIRTLIDSNIRDNVTKFITPAKLRGILIPLMDYLGQSAEFNVSEFQVKTPLRFAANQKGLLKDGASSHPWVTSDTGFALIVQGDLATNIGWNSINASSTTHSVAIGNGKNRTSIVGYYNNAGSEIGRVLNNGRVIWGSTTDHGEKFQVVGTTYLNGGGTFTGGDFALTTTGFLNYNGVAGITSGDIAYLDSVNRVKFSSATIHLDLSNNRLGVFNAAPTYHFDFTASSSSSTGRGVMAVMTDTRASGNFLFAGFSAVSFGQNFSFLTMASNSFAPFSSVNGGYIRNTISGSPIFITTNNAGTEAKHTTFFGNGNGGVAIGNTDSGYKWDVLGTGRYQNKLTLATGTTTVAPLLIPAGTLNSSIGADGTIEFDGTHIYCVIGGVRKQLDN